MESFVESPFLTKHKQMLLVKLGMLVGVDVLFALLAITFLYPKDVILSSYIPALCMVFVIVLSFTAFGMMKQSMKKLLLVALLLSLCLSIFFFSASWWVILSILTFLHWRITSYIESNETAIEVSSGSVLIFLFIASASLLTGPMRDMDNTYIIYCLLFVLFSMIITLTPIQRMITDVKRGNEKVLLKPMGLWVLVAIAGGLLAFVSFLGSRVLYWGAEKGFWLVSFMVNPIFEQLIKLRDMIMNMFSDDAQKGTGSEVQKQAIDQSQALDPSQGLSFSWLNEVLLGLLVLFVIIYLVKKRKASLYLSDSEVHSTTMTTQKILTPVEEDEKAGISYSKARDVIRLSMEKLEEESLMSEAGRYPNENVQLWFNRIGLSGTERFFSIYERVRYGQFIPAQDEVDYFTEKIKIYRDKLKERMAKE
ncbi:hypothetical protein [Rossellomorea sp. NPDC077527]|uniref:hypothetical protein n=1 Tax=Rossellomorea sp. NPDC077527 TaxID=3364510 RepID=UPI0037C5B123